MRYIIVSLGILLFFCQNSFSQDIDNNLIQAIIQVESGCNPNAYNPCSQARGLMQITPIVRSEYLQFNKGCPQYYNSEDNINMGYWYLLRLKDHYLKDKYTIERLLSAYNGGITRLRKLDYDVSRMPKETRDYVRKVMRIYQNAS